MSETPFPAPRPLPGGRTAEMDLDFPLLGFSLKMRAAWELFDAAQDVAGTWMQPGGAPRNGSNIAVGFNVFFTHESAPATFTVTAPSYRGNGLTDQTDDLSEALWIHAAQLDLADRTGTRLLPSRLDHLIDVSPAARAQLGHAAATFTLARLRPPHPHPSGTTHTGWVITLPTEISGDTAVEQISGAELAYFAPTLVTALALPQDHVVLVEGERFRWVSRIDREVPGSGAGATPRRVLTWDPPRPALETVTHTAHGIEFFTEVEPEYRAEAQEILTVVNQRSADAFVDNYALNYGMTFLVFRAEGEGRMRVKTTDVSQPGTAHSTPDLTLAAKLRRAQLETIRVLGKPRWTDVNNCQVTMRVHPGALDGSRITMRREPPEGNESGWVFGQGSGEPQILRAHEVRYRAPAVAAYLPLPAGFEVTLANGQLERAVDGEGTTRWPRA